MGGPLMPLPKVRAQIRRRVRTFKAKCSKYAPALNAVLDQTFEHGPIEQHRVSPEALRHPEFHDLFDAFEHGGKRFYDLSGMGRYHMTGDHAEIDRKPWRPTVSESTVRPAQRSEPNPPPTHPLDGGGL